MLEGMKKLIRSKQPRRRDGARFRLEPVGNGIPGDEPITITMKKGDLGKLTKVSFRAITISDGEDAADATAAYSALVCALKDSGIAVVYSGPPSIEMLAGLRAVVGTLPRGQ